MNFNFAIELVGRLTACGFGSLIGLIIYEHLSRRRYDFNLIGEGLAKNICELTEIKYRVSKLEEKK